MANKVTFEDFEKNIMLKLLEGDDNTLQILRIQYENAIVKSREFTGTGFYTTFAIPNSVPRLEYNKAFQIGDVVGQVDGIRDGVGFVLFVENGFLNMLEGYTYGDEKWPKTIIKYKYEYISGIKRDLEKLRTKWSNK